MLFHAVLAATVFLSTSALAQESAITTPAPAASAVTEVELDGISKAFQARMENLGEQIRATVDASGGDPVAVRPEIDRIVAGFQPDADAFRAAAVSYIQSMPDGPEKDGVVATLPAIETSIKNAPAAVRDQTLARLAAIKVAPQASEPGPPPPSD